MFIYCVNCSCKDYEVNSVTIAPYVHVCSDCTSVMGSDIDTLREIFASDISYLA